MTVTFDWCEEGLHHYCAGELPADTNVVGIDGSPVVCGCACHTGDFFDAPVAHHP